MIDSGKITVTYDFANDDSLTQNTTSLINISSLLTNNNSVSIPSDLKAYKIEVSFEIEFKSNLPRFLYFECIATDGTLEIPVATEKNTLDMDNIITDSPNSPKTHSKTLFFQNYLKSFDSSGSETLSINDTLSISIKNQGKILSDSEYVSKITLDVEYTFITAYLKEVSALTESVDIGFGELNYFSVNGVAGLSNLLNVDIREEYSNDIYDANVQISYKLKFHQNGIGNEDNFVPNHNCKLVFLTTNEILGQDYFNVGADDLNIIKSDYSYRIDRYNSLKYCDQYDLDDSDNSSDYNNYKQEIIKFKLKKTDSNTKLHLDVAVNYSKQYLTTLTSDTIPQQEGLPPKYKGYGGMWVTYSNNDVDDFTFFHQNTNTTMKLEIEYLNIILTPSIGINTYSINPMYMINNVNEKNVINEAFFDKDYPYDFINPINKILYSSNISLNHTLTKNYKLEGYYDIKLGLFFEVNNKPEESNINSIYENKFSPLNEIEKLYNVDFSFKQNTDNNIIFNHKRQLFSSNDIGYVSIDNINHSIGNGTLEIELNDTDPNTVNYNPYRLREIYDKGSDASLAFKDEDGYHILDLYLNSNNDNFKFREVNLITQYNYLALTAYYEVLIYDTLSFKSGMTFKVTKDNIGNFEVQLLLNNFDGFDSVIANLSYNGTQIEKDYSVNKSDIDNGNFNLNLSSFFNPEDYNLKSEESVSLSIVLKYDGEIVSNVVETTILFDLSSITSELDDGLNLQYLLPQPSISEIISFNKSTTYINLKIFYKIKLTSSTALTSSLFKIKVNYYVNGTVIVLFEKDYKITIAEFEKSSDSSDSSDFKGYVIYDSIELLGNDNNVTFMNLSKPGDNSYITFEMIRNSFTIHGSRIKEKVIINPYFDIEYPFIGLANTSATLNIDGTHAIVSPDVNFPNDLSQFPLGYKMYINMFFISDNNYYTKVSNTSYSLKISTNDKIKNFPPRLIEDSYALTYLDLDNQTAYVIRYLYSENTFTMKLFISNYNSSYTYSFDSVTLNSLRLSFLEINDSVKSQVPILPIINCTTNHGKLRYDSEEVKFKFTYFDSSRDLYTPGWIIVSATDGVNSITYNSSSTYNSISNDSFNDGYYLAYNSTTQKPIEKSFDLSKNGTSFSNVIDGKISITFTFGFISGFGVQSANTDTITITKKTIIPDINNTSIVFDDEFISLFNKDAFKLQINNNNLNGPEYTKILKYNDNEIINNSVDFTISNVNLDIDEQYEYDIDSINKSNVAFTYQIIDDYLNDSEIFRKDLILHTIKPDSSFLLQQNLAKHLYLQTRLDFSDENLEYYASLQSNDEYIFTKSNLINDELWKYSNYNLETIPSFNLTMYDQYSNESTTHMDSFTIFNTILDHKSNVDRYNLTNIDYKSNYLNINDSVTSDDITVDINIISVQHVQYSFISNDLVHQVYRNVSVVDRYPPDIFYVPTLQEVSMFDNYVTIEYDYSNTSNNPRINIPIDEKKYNFMRLGSSNVTSFDVDVGITETNPNNLINSSIIDFLDLNGELKGTFTFRNSSKNISTSIIYQIIDKDDDKFQVILNVPEDTDQITITGHNNLEPFGFDVVTPKQVQDVYDIYHSYKNIVNLLVSNQYKITNIDTSRKYLMRLGSYDSLSFDKDEGITENDYTGDYIISFLENGNLKGTFTFKNSSTIPTSYLRIPYEIVTKESNKFQVLLNVPDNTNEITIWKSGVIDSFGFDIVYAHEFEHTYLTFEKTFLIDDAVDGKKLIKMNEFTITDQYTDIQNTNLNYKYTSNSDLLNYRDVITTIENSKNDYGLIVNAHSNVTNIVLNSNYIERLTVKDASSNEISLDIKQKITTLEDDLSIGYTYSNMIVYLNRSNNINESKSLSNLTYLEYDNKTNIGELLFSNVFEDVYNTYFTNLGYLNTINTLSIGYALYSNNLIQTVSDDDTYNTSDKQDVLNRTAFKEKDFRHVIKTTITDIRNYSSNTSMNIYFSPCNYTTITDKDYILNNSENKYYHNIGTNNDKNLEISDKFEFQFSNLNLQLESKYFMDIHYSNIIETIPTSNNKILINPSSTDNIIDNLTSNITMSNMIYVGTEFSDSIIECRYNLGFELDGFQIIGNKNFDIVDELKKDFRIIYDDKLPRTDYSLQNNVYLSNVDVTKNINIFDSYNPLNFTTDFIENMSVKYESSYTGYNVNVHVKKLEEVVDEFLDFNDERVFFDNFSNIQKYTVKYDVTTNAVGNSNEFTYTLHRIPYSYELYHENVDSSANYSIFEENSFIKLNVGTGINEDELICSYKRSKFDITPLSNVYSNSPVQVNIDGINYNTISLSNDGKYLNYDSNNESLLFKIFENTIDFKSNSTFLIETNNNYDYYIKTIDDKFYLSNNNLNQNVLLNQNIGTKYNILNSANERLYDKNKLSFSSNSEVDYKNQLLFLLNEQQYSNIRSNNYDLYVRNLTNDIHELISSEYNNIYTYDESNYIIAVSASNLNDDTYNEKIFQLTLEPNVIVEDNINKLEPKFISPDVNIANGLLKVYTDSTTQKIFHENSVIDFKDLYAHDSNVSDFFSRSELVIEQQNGESTVELKKTFENFSEQKQRLYHIDLPDRFKSGDVKIILYQYNIAHESNIEIFNYVLDKDSLVTCKIQ